MGWEHARRPKVSNKLGIPSPREGSDGDIQVRQTGIGARIFAKLGGRWLSNILHGDELDSPDVFIPTAWLLTGTTPGDGSGTTGGTIGILPDFITKENILGVSMTIGGISNTMIPYGWTLDGFSTYNCLIQFHMDAHVTEARDINLMNLGTALQGKSFKLTIFIK